MECRVNHLSGLRMRYKYHLDQTRRSKVANMFPDTIREVVPTPALSKREEGPTASRRALERKHAAPW